MVEARVGDRDGAVGRGEAEGRGLDGVAREQARAPRHAVAAGNDRPGLFSVRVLGSNFWIKQLAGPVSSFDSGFGFWLRFASSNFRFQLPASV